MKFSVTNIVILLLAAGLTAFGFIKWMESRDKAATEVKAPGGSNQSSAEEDDALTKRMRNAALPEIQEFVSAYIKEPLPDDYVIPQFIIDAGTPEAANEEIGKRYPEFYGLRGNDYLHMIGRYPVRWKAMIDESKAYRKVYAHTRESKSNN